MHSEVRYYFTHFIPALNVASVGASGAKRCSSLPTMHLPQCQHIQTRMQAASARHTATTAAAATAVCRCLQLPPQPLEIVRVQLQVWAAGGCVPHVTQHWLRAQLLDAGAAARQG